MTGGAALVASVALRAWLRAGLALAASSCLSAGDAQRLSMAMPSANVPFVGAAGTLAEPRGDQGIIDVREYGITPEASTCSPGWMRLIADLSTRNPRAHHEVRFGPGIYRFDSPIFISTSNLSIIGASSTGAQATVLRFSKSLYQSIPFLKSEYGDSLAQQWSWRGGMLWIQRNTPGRIAQRAPDAKASVSSLSSHAFELPSPADAVGVSVGDVVSLTHRLALEDAVGIAGHAAVVGHASFASWPFVQEPGAVMLRQRYRVRDVVYDANRQATRVSVDRPIRSVLTRMRESSTSSVYLERADEVIDSVSVRHLAIEFDNDTAPMRQHLQEDGYNALFVRNGYDVSIEHVVMRNVDSAVILESTSGSTVGNLTIEGRRKAHHGISLREQSHENLIDRFSISANVLHGISVQDLSSGNVFSRGVMSAGTFDSHRGMPFDNVRTEIVITPWGSAGGASGPLVGRRMVNWNVEIRWPKDAWGGDPKAKRRLAREAIITGSQWYVMGALVGIRGAEPQPDSLPWELPPGDKGTIVADWGKVPDPPNLYEAQKAWWRSASAAWRAGTLTVK